METPILLIIYKRAETTSQVFAAIRRAQPKRLYIAANAPNPKKETDLEQCQAARDVTENVDWDCEVKRLYRTKHLQAGESVSSSITWLFENEGQGIILEDDCIPNEDFFYYCDELLEKYKNDNRIAVITGRNPLGKYEKVDGSYFLSAQHYSWGWATWKRTWKCFNYRLEDVSYLKYAKSLIQLYGWEPYIIMWRLQLFLMCKLHLDRVNTWDYQFATETQLRKQYSIVPRVNLVSNVGFDANSTHQMNKSVGEIASYSILPVLHPSELRFYKDFDVICSKKRYNRLQLVLSLIKGTILYFFK